MTIVILYGYKVWVRLQGLGITTRVRYGHKGWVRLFMATRVGYDCNGRVWLQSYSLVTKDWEWPNRVGLATRGLRPLSFFFGNIFLFLGTLCSVCYQGCA
jgi:hypothetical protein